MTSSHVMSLSYLDSGRDQTLAILHGAIKIFFSLFKIYFGPIINPEVEEKYRKLSSVKDTIENIMGKWETVYSIPEKHIII